MPVPPLSGGSSGTSWPPDETCGRPSALDPKYVSGRHERTSSEGESGMGRGRGGGPGPQLTGTHRAQTHGRVLDRPLVEHVVRHLAGRGRLSVPSGVDHTDSRRAAPTSTRLRAPRQRPGSPGHARARAYLQRLDALGLAPYRGELRAVVSQPARRQGVAQPRRRDRARSPRCSSYRGALRQRHRRPHDNAAAVAIALSSAAALGATPGRAIFVLLPRSRRIPGSRHGSASARACQADALVTPRS